ncbi:hypothetical protein NMG60_11031710 [Bertholletia excelsa]
MTKIIEHKLNGSNYLESIDKDDHLTCDPPTGNTKQAWLREDAHLFLQLWNSIQKKQDKPLTSYFMKFERTQQEQMAVMSFLASLPPEYHTAKSQILSSPEISSLHDTFTRVLCIESSQSLHPTGSALVRNRGENNGNRGYQHNGNTSNNHELGGVVCYYCQEPGHTKRMRWKLQNKPQQTQMDIKLPPIKTQYPEVERLSEGESAQSAAEYPIT